jgi:purine-binding chemotaxis protein CheW
MQIAVFTLGKEKYALETKYIHGIEKMMTITKVPNAPYYIKGLANLRGSIITIIDLKALLNIKANSEEENIIIVNIDDNSAGFIVDYVEEVLEVKDSMIEQVDTSNKFIKGVINLNDYIVTLLEGEKLLNN